MLSQCNQNPLGWGPASHPPRAERLPMASPISSSTPQTPATAANTAVVAARNAAVSAARTAVAPEAPARRFGQDAFARDARAAAPRSGQLLTPPAVPEAAFDKAIATIAQLKATPAAGGTKRMDGVGTRPLANKPNDAARREAMATLSAAAPNETPAQATERGTLVRQQIDAVQAMSISFLRQQANTHGLDHLEPGAQVLAIGRLAKEAQSPAEAGDQAARLLKKAAPQDVEPLVRSVARATPPDDRRQVLGTVWSELGRGKDLTPRAIAAFEQGLGARPAWRPWSADAVKSYDRLKADMGRAKDQALYRTISGK